MISLIAALDDNNGIGKANGLPWKIPEDSTYFRTVTTGHPVIMGRKTYESMGRLLPNRQNFIVTREEGFSVDGAVVTHTLEEAVEQANKLGDEEVFIIGGGQIYKEAIEKGLADRLYITKIKGDYGCEVFFPDYAEFKKIISQKESHDENYTYTFFILEK
jgi:dihydrofolate reductase